MPKQQYQTKYLRDYTTPDYAIDDVTLRFEIDEAVTLVKSRLSISANPTASGKPLVLDGHDMLLRTIKCDGVRLDQDAYTVDSQHLTIKHPPAKFVLEIEVEIYPQKNTALSGLYKANNIFCTQCEAEGFRKITYYLDRPDVMSFFTTTIVADKTKYPTLLSNGNLIEKGILGDNKHWVTWQDPFKKPCYLFALVAADLDCAADQFITRSGYPVELRLYVDKGNLDKSAYALYALKQAMAWDEEVYNREYDLNIYMVVAVNDFNMGAMENKGLNIFNAKYILVRPDTATDTDYLNVLRVIGHEYFHNWSGNRVTCRDWFQVSLKEGLTIFREQGFMEDMTTHKVKRIEEVQGLRTVQFVEDAGPMAHPVQPDSYIEINNFYTYTVYEKGAEVIRMLRTLLGDKLFYLGMELYFAKNDGKAVTIEEFVGAMEEISKQDLTQFRRWYKQAGTPQLDISSHYDVDKKTFTLKVKQSIAATPGQNNKQPFMIPIVVGFIDYQGNELPITLDTDQKSANKINKVLTLTEAEHEFHFINVDKKPIPSLLRGFSAPVKLNYAYSNEELLILLMHDTDVFNRWEAGQQIYLRTLLSLVADYQNNTELKLDIKFIEAFRLILESKNIDKSLLVELLVLPSEKYIGSQMTMVAVDAIHNVRNFILRQIATELKQPLLNLYHENKTGSVYEVDAESIAKRRLKNTCLALLMMVADAEGTQLCLAQYANSNNMTDSLSALRAITNTSLAERASCLEQFYQRWQTDPLVLDKWFSLQAMADIPNVFDEVVALTKHSAFSLKNPNRMRSLIAVFCQENIYHFHNINGQGYRFLADYIVQLNTINPQIAARLLDPLIQWHRFDATRQGLMKAELQRISQTPNLSTDVYEVVSKSLE